jgi:hypothetical protein
MFCFFLNECRDPSQSLYLLTVHSHEDLFEGNSNEASSDDSLEKVTAVKLERREKKS